MRKSGILIILFLLGMSSLADAQFRGGGGGNEQEVTVQEIENLDDEAVVTLEGYIVEELGDEYYTFKDDTGEIEVEIDQEVWGGQEVGPQTKIRITGEVDKDFTSTTIEVEEITLASEKGKTGW